MIGETDQLVPPSRVYSTLNPATAGTDGKVNAEAQVFGGAVRTGTAGKTTNSLLPLHAAGSGVV
jgi:hypothetical protein